MNGHEASEQILRQAYLMKKYAIVDGDMVSVIALSDLADICNFVGEE
jgi:hypothetical protein